jgi:hypothetical protein
MGAVRHFLKTNILQRDKQQEIYKALQLNFDINPKHALIKKLYTIHRSDNTQLATMLAQQVSIFLVYYFFIQLYFLFFLVNR